MEIKCVCDSSFKKYGRVIEGYDWAPLMDAMNKYTPLPADVAYVPSVPELEAVACTKKNPRGRGVRRAADRDRLLQRQ